MSDANEPLVPQRSDPSPHPGGSGQVTAHPAPSGSGSRTGSSDLGTGGSTLETAQSEASEVAHTAADAAHDVGRVARDEAESVMSEAKDQVQDLYRQTRAELTEEASKQQERVATGLHTVGSDLQSMASGSEDAGLARDLVREASSRVTRIASWIEEREPGDVLEEVKSFARRQPGVFIGIAAIAGVVAGRLTRSLAENARDEESEGTVPKRRVVPASTAPETATTRPQVVPTLPEPRGATGAHASEAPGIRTVGGGASGETPLPSTTPGPASSAGREEGSDERPHTL